MAQHFKGWPACDACKKPVADPEEAVLSLNMVAAAQRQEALEAWEARVEATYFIEGDRKDTLPRMFFWTFHLAGKRWFDDGAWEWAVRRFWNVPRGVWRRRLGLLAGQLQSDDERRQVFDLNLRCFGPPAQRPPHPLTVAPTEDTRYIVGVWEGDLLVSGLWITEREILVDGQPAQMAGIRGVRTDPAFRRRGCGTAGMRAAQDFIWRELTPDPAMLHSSEMAVPFYERRGWRAVGGPVFCDQPAGKLNLTEKLPHNPVMVLLPAGRHALLRGPVDLCGLPFWAGPTDAPAQARTSANVGQEGGVPCGDGVLIRLPLQGYRLVSR
jgi:aminoglycoside 2'-N-acetyltransferase I